VDESEEYETKKKHLTASVGKLKKKKGKGHAFWEVLRPASFEKGISSVTKTLGHKRRKKDSEA